jgi:hypothetical protein
MLPLIKAYNEKQQLSDRAEVAFLRRK